MNKFEKLIEYIINDEDQKARELFHSIVVEKSRDIYESIMDEESMEEMVHGDQVEDLTNEIDGEEAMEGEDDFGDDDLGDEEGEDDFGGEEEFDLDGEEDGELGGELGGEEDFGGEEGGDHTETVMNIDAKLDELLAKFDEIMGGEEGAGEEFGGEEGGEFGGEEFGSDEDFGNEEGAEEEFGGEEGGEEGMMESGNPFAKGSGKSGSAKSGMSGKSGSAMSGKSGSAKSGKSGKPFESTTSTAQLMREYVDKIGDIYGGEGDAAEGTIVGANTGTKDKTTVNKKSTSLTSGPDFGGTSENIVTKKGRENTIPDGTGANKGEDNYGKKGQGKLIGKVGNTPGGDKQLKGQGTNWEKQPEGQEGKPAGAKQTMGSNINKKSEIGGKIR